MHYLFKITTDGKVARSEFPKTPEYKILQSGVSDGMPPDTRSLIQKIPYFRIFEYEGYIFTRGMAWANEEGLVYGLPINARASQLWRAQFPHATTLAGSILYVVKAPSGERAKT